METQGIVFDFDKKDFPSIKSEDDLLSVVKSKIPQLYNHMVVRSGSGGIHVYLAITPTSDIKRAVKITKDIAMLLDADPKACLSTQIVRVATTINYKRDDHTIVTVMNNTLGTDKYKPYTLDRLESIIKANSAHSDSIKYDQDDKPEFKPIGESSVYYCIERMLKDGAPKGVRNYALGKIVKYLQLRRYQKPNAVALVMEWNKRCSPPKVEHEVMSDFNRYWEGDYKLLGCHIDDPVKQEYIDRYCDRALCKTAFQRDMVRIDAQEASINNSFLTNTHLQNLSGNDYLILTILHIWDRGLTKDGIKKEITGRKTKAPCMCDATLSLVLDNLLRAHFIDVSKKGKYAVRSKFNIKGITRFFYSVSILLINKIISQTEYRVYIALVRNLQVGQQVSYDWLAAELAMDPSNVGKAIRGLDEAHALSIRKCYDERGAMVNSYTLIA